MFIETCLACFGLFTGSELYQKIRTKADKTGHKERQREKTYSLVATAEEKYQDFFQRKIDPLFMDPRRSQMKRLSQTEHPELSPEEKKNNRNIGIASVNIGIAVILRAFYPHLLVATAPFILFLGMGWLKSAFHSIFRKHRLDMSVLDGVLVIWILLSGYFFAGSFILFMLALQKKLLARTQAISHGKLIDVFGQHSHSVWIMTDGAEFEIPFNELKAGDIFVVKAGELVPADGTVKKGMATVDQHVLTGESRPAEKEAGDQIFASTLVLSGKIYVLAEKAGQETTAANIVEILNRTASHRTSLESEAEKFADRSVLPTFALSGLAYTLAGSNGGLAVLFSGIGYNMRIVGPVSTLNFLRIAAENSILIKDICALERLSQIDTFIFDKTGTLTLERPHVGAVHSCNGLSQETLLTYAAAAEYRQVHPIARAILAAAEEQGLNIPEIEDASYKVGYGISVNLSEQLIRVGSERFMETENLSVPDNLKMIKKECDDRGYTLVIVAVDDKVSGAVELHPTIRPEAKQVIRYLALKGRSACIISGDSEMPTQVLAEELEINRYFASILPEGKGKIIEQLQEEGKKVCFIGDGINDTIALKKADVSVSLCGASPAATDCADIVLMDGNLDSLSRLLDISLEFQSNWKENLVISVIPGVICISGVFLLHFGIYASMILYYLGLGAGLSNATLPLIRHNKKTMQIKKQSNCKKKIRQKQK